MKSSISVQSCFSLQKFELILRERFLGNGFFSRTFAGPHQSRVMEMNEAFLQECLNSGLVFSALPLTFCCVKLFWFTAESISMKRCCGRKDVWKSMSLVLRTWGKPIAGLTQKCSRLLLCGEAEAGLGMGGRQRQTTVEICCVNFSLDGPWTWILLKLSRECRVIG